jgi:CBS domain containing-hemolysin-like protein
MMQLLLELFSVVLGGIQRCLAVLLVSLVRAFQIESFNHQTHKQTEFQDAASSKEGHVFQKSENEEIGGALNGPVRLDIFPSV